MHCQEQTELSGFVANELSAFSVHREGSIMNRKRAADVRILILIAGVIHSPSPAAFAEHGGRGLWVTPSGRFFYLLELPSWVIISQLSRTMEDSH
jgi:hypothetical protein